MLKLPNNYNVKVLHLEPTDVCNAACPLCARELDPNFNKSAKHHLTVDQIKAKFSEEFIRGLDKMFMCGTYGDPAAASNAIEIYKYFRQINSKITLGMNTNGSIRDVGWWESLASIMTQPLDYVVFSIDGLEDTNHIYRVNTIWDKIMKNAESFINAGGSAHWDMLVYQHNEHQVDEAEKLARVMGFTCFRAKVSKRPLIKNLERPSKVVKWKPLIQVGKIECIAMREQSLYMDARGRISPCCWLGGTQVDTVDDFDNIIKTWETATPNKICKETCTTNIGNNFSNQFQKNIELS